MAGDWIKMRVTLHENPRVMKIAADLGLDELHVVGMLWRIWAWADQHTESGNAVSVTDVTLDALVNRNGFAKALRDVGWLDGKDWEISFVRYSDHNGQTAKTRALTQKRVATHRRNDSVTHEALPEKRREEKNSTPLKPPRGFPPELDHQDFISAWSDWHSYRRERKLATWKPRTVEAQLKILAEMGRPAAIASIRQSIANGWNGLFQPKTNDANSKHSPEGTSRGFKSASDYSRIGLDS